MVNDLKGNFASSSVPQPAPLSLRGLDASIGKLAVAKDVNLDFHSNSCWGILGRNGVGKTTLLHVMAGLRDSENGEILLQGLSVSRLSSRERARRVGVLFQDYADVFPATVLETVATGRYAHTPPWPWRQSASFEAARSSLRELGLNELVNRTVDTLSGGERRRVALATLFCQAPQILLLDEPANHLDIHHQMALFESLDRWRKNRERLVVAVMHDVNLTVRFCDHVLLLFGDGKWLAGPTETVVTDANLTRLYQHPMTMHTAGDNTWFTPR